MLNVRMTIITMTINHDNNCHDTDNNYYKSNDNNDHNTDHNYYKHDDNNDCYNDNT